MVVASAMLWLLAVYVAVGAIVGIAFVCVGVGRVEPAARGAGVAFRLVILPGCVGLWPVVLVKWRSAS